MTVRNMAAKIAAREVSRDAVGIVFSNLSNEVLAKPRSAFAAREKFSRGQEHTPLADLIQTATIILVLPELFKNKKHEVG